MEVDKKAFLLTTLTRSAGELEASVTNVDPVTWFQCPDEGRWSIGQCAEHIITVEKRVLVGVERMSALPPEAYDEADSARKDELILLVENREQRFKAPEILEPTSKYPGAAEFLTDFKSHRAQTTQLVEDFPDWLRGRFTEHPVLHKLDGYQWLLASAIHTLRHTAQIEEVKHQLQG